MKLPSQAQVISGVVALVGPPNAGKSTLLNTLLGQKISIVTPKPQTTRNRIAGILNEQDSQIVILDTPGLHKARTPLNQEMMRIAMATLVAVDVALFMIDVSLPRANKRAHQEAFYYREYGKKINCPAMLLLNKVDLIKRPEVLPIIEFYASLYPFASIIPVSALHGEGTETVITQLKPMLPKGPRLFPEDMPTDVSERFLVAEIIREKVFLLTGQEIPYAAAVSIESFQEDERRNRVEIHATIYLERKSQKGIVIGKGGSKLKSIGIAARQDIEKLLGLKVSLQLWVKIKKNWTKDEHFIKELGW